MNAKKCDACGKFYETNTNDYFIRSNVLSSSSISGLCFTTASNKYVHFDLCDSCVDDIFKNVFHIDQKINLNAEGVLQKYE